MVSRFDVRQIADIVVPGTIVKMGVHLLAAAVWTGGLAGIVVLGIPAWRALPGGDESRPNRAAGVGELLPRFSRLAVVSTALLVASGFLAARGNLGAVANLVRFPYGRLLLAKLVLLAAALALGARHLPVIPGRMRLTFRSVNPG